MDTLILVLGTAGLFTVGYAVFWTVRAVRRVGPRRFAVALGALAWAVLVACSKLFRPDRGAWRWKHYHRDDVWIDVVEDGGNGSQPVSEHSGPGFHFNHRTGSFDDGLDPDGIYFSHDQPS